MFKNLVKKIVKNVRFGFATNSSSSHSFVYFKKPNYVKGVKPNSPIDFGWGDFKLDTLYDKLFYVLVSMVGNTFSWNANTEEIEETIDKAYSLHKKDFLEFDRYDFSNAVMSSVDHQSKGLLTVDEARDPYVVVFGGNDNNCPASEERSRAIFNKEIDWETSVIEYEDMDSMAKDDYEGREKYNDLLGKR